MRFSEPRSWTLEQALETIRHAQVGCMARGFYLSLSGGVLNRGQSENDLDLLAMHMTELSDPRALIRYLTLVWGPIQRQKIITGRLHLRWPQSLELKIVTLLPIRE